MSSWGKTQVSASCSWLVQTCLHFGWLKTVGLDHDCKPYKMIEMINWIRSDEFINSTGCPNRAWYLQKHFGMEWKRKAIKEKSKQTGYFIHRYYCYRIVTVLLPQMKICRNENFYLSFPFCHNRGNDRSFSKIRKISRPA